MAARTLYRLFVDNLFVSAITFESGDAQVVIAYPWGSLNHRKQLPNGSYISKEAPDFKAFQALGLAMQESAGKSVAFINEKVVLKEYEIGDATSTSFSLQGSLTDWAYGAGWDNTTDATLD